MIAVRLEGRLGNQLFQYAFIHATAKELKTDFYIDQYIQRAVADKYFKNINGRWTKTIVKLFDINGVKNIFSYHLRRLYYKNKANRNKLIVCSYNYEASRNEIKIRDNIIYHGYFQSESFFECLEKPISSIFILKKKFTDQFKLKFKELYQNNKIVTVHIRRTDYKNSGHLNLGGNDLSLPLEYYKKAISKYDGHNVHFVFVSDDIDFVNENFKEINNKTISADTEIMDFQHLVNADGCIISNSTFSWWGARLNSKPGKVIYAPRYFLGWRIKKETPPRIYPPDWNLIDF